MVVLDFLFWFSSAILVSKIKSLIFNLSTSASVTNLFIDYSGKYELIYSIKDLH